VTLTSAALLGGSAFLAGIMNAVAGGGTLVTFPSLLAAGLSPVSANVTSTVALYPGQVASSLVYRGHLDEVRRRITFFAVPSLLGGVLGSSLLLLLPARTFEVVVPWLILFACALLALQTPLRAALARWPHADHPAALWSAQLAISIYGGYFGAGIGILMLAAMGLLLAEGLQHANALKNLNALFTNTMAVLLFVALGDVRWSEAAVMAAAAMAGGWVGAHFARRLSPALMRGIAIAIGLAAAARFLVRG
jgi:uncharacterized membrane protein YfcA